MQKFLLSAILFFLVLITFSLFFFFYEAQYFGSRASVTVVDFSADNSYVFINPRSAQANGIDKIRVTVMVLNGNGLGVMGKKPSIEVDPKVTKTTVQEVTNTLGEALFEFSTTSPGDYYIKVKIDETEIPQKTPLSFYQ